MSDATYDHGQVGLGLDSCTISQFDDLEVLPAPNAEPRPPPAKGRLPPAPPRSLPVHP
ncbi:hypothetical protein [Streptomyces spinosirectus]